MPRLLGDLNELENAYEITEIENMKASKKLHLCLSRTPQLVILCLTLALLSGMADSIKGQTTSSGTSGGRPAGNYSLDGFANVNPFNGNLNFSLPITSLDGRGNSGISVPFTIETRWRLITGIVGQTTMYSYEPETLSGALSNGPGKLTASLVLSDYYEATCGEPQWQPSRAKLKLIFTTSDGTSYQLRGTVNNGSPYEVSHCYHTQPRYNHGTEFIAWDGSGVKFISDVDIKSHVDVQGDVVSGILVLPNGTKYRIENGLTTWIQDRNGNRSTFTYVNGSSVDPTGFIRIQTATDSLNRTTLFEYGQFESIYGYHTRITTKGIAGQDRVVRISYKNLQDALRSGSTDFPFFHVASDLWLPDGRKYSFLYSSYGLLAQVILPTGGKHEFDYSVINAPLSVSDVNNGAPYIRVSEQRTYADGINLTKKTVFGHSDSYPNSIATIDKYDENANRLSHSKHYFYGNPVPPLLTGMGVFEDEDAWNKGREYKTEIYGSDGITLLRKTETEWEWGSFVSWNPYGTGSTNMYRNTRVGEIRTTLVDSNQVSKTVYGYDAAVPYNLQTDVFEYDYGSGQPGSFIRRSHTEYEKSSTYTSSAMNLLTLPKETWVSSDIGGSSIVSRTKYEYDNYSSDANHAPLVVRSNITAHDSNYGTGFTVRGNLTGITRYANAQAETGAVSGYSQYDVAGNVVKAIDAKGNASTISYNDNFGSPDAEARTNTAPTSLGGQQTFAFATSATNAVGYSTYSQFDYFTGAVVNAEDILGNVSATFYNDPLDRPTQTISANNISQFRKQAVVDYDDANRKITVTGDSKSFGDNLIKSEAFYDGLGRTFEARTYETTTEYIRTLTEFDVLGRAYRSSTPHRPHLSEQPEWTETTFDDLGRVIKVKMPNNAFVTRSYAGNTTTVTDQAGRKRTGFWDSIGRLLKVIEDPTGQGYETTYTYDVLSRLRKITQTEGGTTQNRFFMHNDLGLLIRAKQTEQTVNANLNVTDPVTGNAGWSVKYEHDLNGNVVSTTDANNRTVTGTYDDLNRLTYRNYSDSTPDVTFTYDDQQIANSTGQLTSVTSSVSSTHFTAFDELGRIKSSRQATNGTYYDFSDYSYDFAGALVSQTYPSGRVVEIETDNLGRLSKVTGQVSGQTERTYLGNLGYTSFGAVRYARLGNGKWESAGFDPKTLQIEEIRVGSSAADAGLLKIEYDFGTTDNNGSLRQQKITVPGAPNPIIQNYTYDALNRLKSATETTNSQVAWKQTFDYDRFGNKRFDVANTTTLGSCSQAVCNPNIDLETNRLASSDGYSFDSAGNLTANPENHLFTYDAENRQTHVENTASQATADYFYDGSGKRVRKIQEDQETVFVYDAFGKLAAEYSTEVSQDPKISYLTTDNLGSPRIITDQLGQVVARRDFMPFGEEVMAGVGGRTPIQGYGGNDDVRQKFTGYERDDESGLDYAQARYFKPAHGRFTSVDPLAASANIKNPQTLNRYTYVLNSPYKFTDPLGLAPCGVSGTTGNGSPCTQADDWDTSFGGETARAEADYDRRLQNTNDALAATRAFARGDSAAGWLIIRSNETLQARDANGNTLQDPNEPTVEVEATVLCCQEGPYVLPEEILNKYGSEQDYPKNVRTDQKRCGNGSCAVLPQILSNFQVPLVEYWVQGDRVVGNRNMVRGTVIATFNDNGFYGPPGTTLRNQDQNNHAAIYLSSGTYGGRNGIFVIDQWQGPRRPYAGIRFIPEGTGKIVNPSNDARAFSRVMSNRPGTGW